MDLRPPLEVKVSLPAFGGGNHQKWHFKAFKGVKNYHGWYLAVR